MTPSGPPTLAFVTLGCPKNTVDSENMLGLMVEAGFRTVADVREADVAVVNTCAFLQSAIRESKDAIGQVASLKRDGRLRGLIVAGCLAQRSGRSLLDEFPEVDAVLGTGQWREVVTAAHHVLADGTAERFANTEYPGGALDALSPRALSTPRHLAYLKISEGCDHRCTFCVIPQLRGDQQSRPLDDIVAEARRLAALGVREINLIGQDTTGWGTDLPGRPELADLLEALDAIDVDWIRVQYTYPRLWSDRLIATWAKSRRVVPYVDMPLQHIAQDMLRTMARAMTERDTRALVRRIKEGIPGVAFRTNVIVGFPGETDEHFETLLRFLEEEPLDHVVAFTYEREPGTPGYDMTPRVPQAVRTHRRARLLAHQQRLSRDRLARRIGERVTVMVDGPAKRGQWAARTAGQAFEVDGGVVVEGHDLRPGQLVDVRVTGASAYDLFATVESAGPALLNVSSSRGSV